MAYKHNRLESRYLPNGICSRYEIQRSASLAKGIQLINKKSELDRQKEELSSLVEFSAFMIFLMKIYPCMWYFSSTC